MYVVLINRMADILLFNNEEIYAYVGSISFIGLSRLYICFTVCVFILLRRIGFYSLNKRINAMPKFRWAIICCWNIFVPRTFVSASKKIKKRISKVATVLKNVKLNRVKPRKVKYKAYQFLKNQLYLLLSAKFIAAAAALCSCSME